MKEKAFYVSAFLRALAEGLISPFLPVFALSLNASKTLIGLLSSLPNISGLFSQLIFSNLAEFFKKKFLIILGSILWAFFWIPIAYVKDPVHLIILISLQSIFYSISIPAWTALFIQSTSSYKRGRITGFLNTWSGIGSFIGNLTAGIILNKFGFVPFFFSLIFLVGLICRIPFIPFKEFKPRKRTLSRVKNAIKNTFNFSNLKKNKKFLNFIIAISFLNFSVAIPGPFFSVYLIQKIGGTKLDIAIISAIGILTAVVFSRSWGTIIDFFGKRVVMVSCLLPISFIPFVYAISNHVIWLYLYAIIAQMSWVGFNLAAFAYLSDLLPKENLSSNVAVYNLFTGLSSSVGPFVGGIIAEFTSIWFVFIVSFIMRSTSIYFFKKLGERPGYKPRGTPYFGIDLSRIPHGIETFISTYSLVLEEFRKESMGFLSMLEKLRRTLEKRKT